MIHFTKNEYESVVQAMRDLQMSECSDDLISHARAAMRVNLDGSVDIDDSTLGGTRLIELVELF